MSVVSDVADFFSDAVMSYKLTSSSSIRISGSGKLSWLMCCLS